MGDGIINQNSLHTDWVFHKGAGTALENMAVESRENVSVTLPQDATITTFHGRAMAVIRSVGLEGSGTITFDSCVGQAQIRLEIQ